jgi:hypothetical protein
MAFAIAGHDGIYTQLEMEPVTHYELWCILFRLNAPQADTILGSIARQYVKYREVTLPLVTEKKRSAGLHGGWREIEQLPHCLMMAVRIEPRQPFYLVPTKSRAWDDTGEQIFRHRLTPLRVAQHDVQSVTETATGAENTPYHGE